MLIATVKNRRELVDWLSELGEKLELETLTIHVGVAYMDVILQTTPFAREERQVHHLMQHVRKADYLKKC